MKQIGFDYSNASKFLGTDEVMQMKYTADNARERLNSGKGEGGDFQGWINLPIDYDREEFARIKAAARRIQADSDILLVIGIGGSYLGARAAIEFLRHGFYNELSDEKRGTPQIFYVGNSMSGTYIKDLEDILDGKDFSINVISKSGTTTESAIAFRVFRDLLVNRYGMEEASGRIYATTDRARGALKAMADKEGYECFVIPDDIGGRFSVLTAVGLLPIAVSGADIDRLMEGAAAYREIALNSAYEENPSLLYAALRNILYRKGKTVEVLVNYEPSHHYISEWFKQLAGESEGKDQKGIMPASVDFTTDLHSMGQFIQEGSRIKFETVLRLEKPKRDFALKEEADNLDGLNYLSGKSMDFVNKCAMQGTIEAHVAGGNPNLLIVIPEQNEYYLGQLFYFFEYAIAISGYINAINPFNQPGVEFYKSNMFRLLGKPEMEKNN